MTTLQRIEAAKGNPEALYAIAVELATMNEKTERQTWLTPSCKAWEKEMGAGTFPYGKAGKALAGLYRANWSPEEIGKRLGFYIRALRRDGDLRYLSLPKFAEQFGTFDPNEPAFEEEQW